MHGTQLASFFLRGEQGRGEGEGEYKFLAKIGKLMIYYQ